jgi:ABC-2 type transport system ATP-binding protein
METLLEVENLSKKFGDVQAVKSLSLKINAGEVVALVGPNGCGKTTALRCICTIMKADTARIRICGHDAWDEGEKARGNIGFVPELPYPYPYLTVREHIRFICRAYSVKGHEQRAEELLKKFDLYEKRDELAHTLSKGMRQKLLLISALIHEPKVLVLDEPMIGVDPKGVRALKDGIREMKARGGCVLISSHVLSLVEEVCDRVLVMVKGSVVAQGTIPEMLGMASGVKEKSLEEAFLAITSRLSESDNEDG